jgi:hypothetical protein
MLITENSKLENDFRIHYSLTNHNFESILLYQLRYQLMSSHDPPCNDS